MNLEQKVENYLTSIGADYSNFKLVRDNEAFCNLHNIDSFMNCLNKANFSQYHYAENSVLEKLGALKIANELVKEHYFQHQNLHAYILVVEYPYAPEHNYVYLSNEPVSSKHWLTVYMEDLKIPTKEDILISLQEKKEYFKKIMKNKWCELKSKYGK